MRTQIMECRSDDSDGTYARQHECYFAIKNAMGLFAMLFNSCEYNEFVCEEKTEGRFANVS